MCVRSTVLRGCDVQPFQQPVHLPHLPNPGLGDMFLLLATTLLLLSTSHDTMGIALTKGLCDSSRHRYGLLPSGKQC